MTAVPKLAGKRLEALRLLAGGATVLEASRELGISDRTLRYWRAAPEFREALAAAGVDSLEHARGALAEGACEAAETLLAIATDGTAPHSARVRAACEVLSRAGIASSEESEDGRDVAILLGDGRTIVLGGVRYRQADTDGDGSDGGNECERESE